MEESQTIDNYDDQDFDKENSQVKGRERKSIFIKAKFQNFSKQIYSILIWEGIWLKSSGYNRLDFLQVDFSLSSYAYEYNKLKYKDSISEYLDSIKQSRMETLTHHTKLFSMLQKTLEREFKNADIRNDETGNIKSLIREIEETIERCYKEVFYDSRFNLNFGQEIYEENEVVSAKISTSTKVDEEVLLEWDVPEDANILEMTAVIDPNHGISITDLAIGDQLWLTLLLEQGKANKKIYTGEIKQIVRGREVGYRFLVDLGENTYGDLEIMEHLIVKALKKDSQDIEDYDFDDNNYEEIDEALQEAENEIEPNNNFGFIYFIIVSALVLMGLFYLFFLW